MRLRHHDGTAVHLGYCTNVHPAEDVAGIVGQLDLYGVPVRERLAVPRLGLGLWLAHEAAAELARDAAAARKLRAELDARGLEVVTLNGFPYQGFHQEVVKHAVYRPDWSEQARLDYTTDLARVLAVLLPDDATRGSISTLPLGWRTGWGPAEHDQARRHLDLLGRELDGLRRRTGREIRVAFEPEPGCLIESTDHAATHLSSLDPRHFGLCLDVCHLAVAFEDPGTALDTLARSGIPVVKAQISCALHADHPDTSPVRRALAAFAEPRFLHQTRQSGNPLAGVDDLALALAYPAVLPGTAPWRTHFHIPVHADPVPPLATTRPVLQQTLAALFAGDHPGTDHLEVETYTWSVLPRPPSTSAELADGIAAELDWTRRELSALGLRSIG
ncbi:metabolite traffic protein EboE [Sphaerisporangium fuscum]|uniref:metabolite traffic protein EboE n=1 Tax=Sphaerisporangium fuscum TaxID=2835868 RepID=UPI001BDCB8C3|nr:metabolite traffic protein EboE [Sphaerisporangium fuscum]